MSDNVIVDDFEKIIKQMYTNLSIIIEMRKHEYDISWLFETDNFLMRPLFRNDADTVFRIICDKKSIEMSGDYQVDMRYVLMMCDQQLSELPALTGDSVELGIISKQSGEMVGEIQLFKSGIQPEEMSEFIGASEQNDIDITDDEIQNGITIGYSLDPKYWGKGIMTEVVKGVIKFTFDVLHVPAIFGECLLTNIGSCRVMEKNGFKQLGISGSYRDQDKSILRSYYVLKKSFIKNI